MTPEECNAERDPATGCWIWQGRSHNGRGYGPGEMAARLIWRAAFGPITPGKLICHHCDNPMCVNPAHLYMGTRSDNARDCVKRGRWRGGRPRGPASEGSGRVYDLRKRLGLSQQAFADRIGADQSTVSRWEQKGARPSGPAIKLLEYLEACAAPALTTASPRPSAEAAQ